MLQRARIFKFNCCLKVRNAYVKSSSPMSGWENWNRNNREHSVHCLHTAKLLVSSQKWQYLSCLIWSRSYTKEIPHVFPNIELIYEKTWSHEENCLLNQWQSVSDLDGIKFWDWVSVRLRGICRGDWKWDCLLITKDICEAWGKGVIARVMPRIWSVLALDRWSSRLH